MAQASRLCCRYSDTSALTRPSEHDPCDLRSPGRAAEAHCRSRRNLGRDRQHYLCLRFVLVSHPDCRILTFSCGCLSITMPAHDFKVRSRCTMTLFGEGSDGSPSSLRLTPSVFLMSLPSLLMGCCGIFFILPGALLDYSPSTVDGSVLIACRRMMCLICPVGWLTLLVSLPLAGGGRKKWLHLNWIVFVLYFGTLKILLAHLPQQPDPSRSPQTAPSSVVIPPTTQAQP